MTLHRIGERLFPGPLPIVTPAMLYRWSVVLGGVGFAQLFRSTLEQIVGLNFLVAAIILFVAATTGRTLTAFFGLTWGAAWVFGRAAGAPFYPNATWHGVTIIVLAWGMFAYLLTERAVSVHYRFVSEQERGH